MKMYKGKSNPQRTTANNNNNNKEAKFHRNISNKTLPGK